MAQHSLTRYNSSLNVYIIQYIHAYANEYDNEQHVNEYTASMYVVCWRKLFYNLIYSLELKCLQSLRSSF